MVDCLLLTCLVGGLLRLFVLLFVRVFFMCLGGFVGLVLVCCLVGARIVFTRLVWVFSFMLVAGLWVYYGLVGCDWFWLFCFGLY